MACEFLEKCPAALGRCVREGAAPEADCAERLICAYLEEHAENPAVLYLCDQRQCGDCSAVVGQCFHTSDIGHAKNFEELWDGLFFEGGERILLDGGNDG